VTQAVVRVGSKIGS